jgi:hypothetical protein
MGAVIGLVIGALLLLIGADKARFERVWGPTLRAQYLLDQRLWRRNRRTYERWFSAVRVTVLAFGVLCIAIGVIGVITWLA